MRRIEEIINCKSITLDNKQVKFQVKLLQYNINNLIFKYKNRYAFQEYIDEFIEKISNEVIKSNLKDDEEANEVITKARNIIISLKKHKTVPSKQELEQAIDSTLRFILYQYAKHKEEFGLYEQIELLQELKIIVKMITKNKITITPRINNAYALERQLMDRIAMQL